MDNDPVMVGFIRLKSLLIEAQEEFGPEKGKHILALAMKIHSAQPEISTRQAFYGLCEIVRQADA